MSEQIRFSHTYQCPACHFMWSYVAAPGETVRCPHLHTGTHPEAVIVKELG
jgi:hypothetical protein